MSLLTVLLTLPHCVCEVDPIKPSQRTCDRNSKLFATHLKSKLDTLSYIECHLIESGQSRHPHYKGLDDNRYNVQNLSDPIDESLKYPIFQQQNFNRQSKLWIRLRKFTQDYYRRHKSFENLIILDCHSFPQESNKGLDLYLIDYKVNHSWSILGNFIQ